MPKLFRAVARGIKGATGANAPGRFKVGGKIFHCPACRHDVFANGAALLNTTGMTLIGLDWANKEATTLVCTECGKIEWFAREPPRA